MPIVAVATAAVGGIIKLAKSKVGKAIGKGIGKGIKKIGSLFGKKKKKKAAEAAKKAAALQAPALTTVKTSSVKGVLKNALLTGAKAAYSDLTKEEESEIQTDTPYTGRGGDPNKNFMVLGVGLVLVMGAVFLIIRKK